jgi:hypothetical protein
MVGTPDGTGYLMKGEPAWDVIQVTFFLPGGHRRSVTDACGLLRTLAS